MEEKEEVNVERPKKNPHGIFKQSRVYFEEPISGHLADSELLIFNDIAIEKELPKIFGLFEMRYAIPPNGYQNKQRRSWIFWYTIYFIDIDNFSVSRKNYEFASYCTHRAQRIHSIHSIDHAHQQTAGWRAPQSVYILLLRIYLFGNKIKPYVIFNRGFIISSCHCIGWSVAGAHENESHKSVLVLQFHFRSLAYFMCSVCLIEPNVTYACRFATRIVLIKLNGIVHDVRRVRAIVVGTFTWWKWLCYVKKKPFAIYDCIWYNS